MAAAASVPTSLAIITSLVLLLTAISSARAATTSCGARLLSLTPCMAFAQGMAPSPTDACCDGLADVYRDQPLCLCLLVNQSSSSSIPLNRTLALQLPLLCRLALSPNNDPCPGISLLPLRSQRQNATSDAAAVSPAMVRPPRMSNVLLNAGGKLKVEGAPVIFIAIALVLAGAFDHGMWWQQMGQIAYNTLVLVGDMFDLATWV